MNSPAAEEIIAKMVASTNVEDFIIAAQAWILTAGRYLIPVWYSKVSRLAWSGEHLHHPETLPVYGDWPGLYADVWWYED